MIVGFAVETTHSLNNAVYSYDTPEEAVRHFAKDLVLEDGEAITMILATFMEDEFTTYEEGVEFAREVERLFEAAYAHWFVEGYFGEQE